MSSRASLVPARSVPISIAVAGWLFVVELWFRLFTSQIDVQIPLALWRVAVPEDKFGVTTAVSWRFAEAAVYGLTAVVIGVCFGVVATRHLRAGRPAGRIAVTVFVVGTTVASLPRPDLFTALTVSTSAVILLLLYKPVSSQDFFRRGGDHAVPRRSAPYFWIALLGIFLVAARPVSSQVIAWIEPWVNQPDSVTQASVDASIRSTVSAIDLDNALIVDGEDAASITRQIEANLTDQVMQKLPLALARTFVERATGRFSQLGYMLAMSALLVGVLSLLADFSRGWFARGHGRCVDTDTGERVRILTWERRDDGWYVLCSTHALHGKVELSPRDTKTPRTYWKQACLVEPVRHVTVPTTVHELARALVSVALLLLPISAVVLVSRAAGGIASEYTLLRFVTSDLNPALRRLEPPARDELQNQVLSAAVNIQRGAITAALSTAAAITAILGLYVAIRRRRSPVGENLLFRWTETRDSTDLAAEYVGTVTVTAIRPGRRGWEGHVRADGRIGVRNLGWFPLTQLELPPSP